ncbi:hypothetical protein DMC01_13315 [Campylobacter troglodytis]|nr:hypothetical protein DMC01_13315 [Campylobacter troglodytis]
MQDEIAESYFLLRFCRNCVVEGAKRMRAKRGHGAKNTCIFTSYYTLITLREGMLKRNGYVYTQLVKISFAKKSYYMGFKRYE